MMKDQRRFLVKYNDSHLRPFSLGILQDSWGSYYLKIMLPALRKQRLLKARIQPSKNGQYEATAGESIDQAVAEFSYHYQDGVRHLKGKDGHILQTKSLPKLQDKKILHLLRMRLFVPDSIDIYGKKLADRDVVSHNGLHDNGNVWNIYLVSTASIRGVNIIAADTKLQYANTYVLQEFLDSEVAIVITESIFIDKPEEHSGVDIFFYDNPTQPLDPPKMGDEGIFAGAI